MTRSNSTLTIGEVRERLRQRVLAAGGPGAWAARHGVGRGYVADVETGRRPPSDRILRAIGLRREERFREINVGDLRTAGRAPATEAERVRALLLPEEARALDWLPRDGSARDRSVRGEGWRPGPEHLRRLVALGLATGAAGGHAATELGRQAQSGAGEDRTDG